MNRETGRLRILYIDNIRIYLTVLVVLHHVAIGYGGVGGWFVIEAPSDSISPVLLFLFNALNQSYFMSFFFLLSGYFLCGSCNRKGPGPCMRGRLVRLGIPLLAYIVLIAPSIDYLVLTFTRHRDVTLFQVFSYFITRHRVDVGPLWFVEALLIFSALFVIRRRFLEQRGREANRPPFMNRFPSSTAIVISILALSAGTFLVRLVFPIGVWIVHFQLAHFVHYIFCFCAGILAYRGNWLEHLSAKQWRLWTWAALGSVILLPVIVGISLATGNGPEIFFGGFSFAALAAALWESMACLSIIIALLGVFRKWLNHQGRIAKTLSRNAYTVYLIHALVITALMAALYNSAWPSAAKFGLVSLLGVAGCFLISHFVIRRLPGAKRVLG